MFPAPLLLALLILTTPATLLFDGPVMHGAIMAVTAVSLAIVTLRIRIGEAEFLSYVIRPTAIVAAIPAAFMLLQVMPAFDFANPIWKSAAAALGQSLQGSISVDPGVTLMAFARYLSWVAIIFFAAAVAIDRRRAEWILSSLIAATTLIALLFLTGAHGKIPFLSTDQFDRWSAAAIDCAGMGMVLAAAGALHALTRGKTHKGTASYRFQIAFGASVVAGIISTIAVFDHGTVQTSVAVISGIATLAALAAIRRFRVGPWGLSAIVSVGFVIAIAAAFFHPGRPTPDPTLRFAARAPAPLIAVTKSILVDAGWAGTGAGTFGVMLPIYRDMNELTTGRTAPTAVAAVAVEMGRPFLWTVLAAVIVLIVIVLRGALRRGRDYYYAMATAVCAETVAMLAFANVGVLDTPAMVIAGATIGLGIAQSKSRSELQ